MSFLEIRTSLKASCARKALFEAVQTVGHAVSGRNPLPILSHIVIHSEGPGLRLMATDLELGISCRIPEASISEEGALTAPSKLVTEVLANLPEKGEVSISVDKSHTVHVNCERSNYKILGLPADEYPKLPEVADTVRFSIQQSKLKEMIRHTLFAVSTDEARAILTGVLMVFEENSLKFVATDTHRLAVKTSDVIDGQGSQNAIVPSRVMNELMRLLTDQEGIVEVTLSGNQIQFALPGETGVRIISKLIEGQFPNYARVIPSAFQKKLTIPVQLLQRAVRRASIVARENAQRVVLRTEDGKLILTAESQMVGNAHEEIEIIQNGEDVEIAFNAKYLLDVLNNLDSEEVNLELTEPLKPGVLRPVMKVSSEEQAGVPMESDYLCVLMPMQIV